MKINHWPLNERPREKLINLSAKALSNAELIAILIQCGTKDQTALDVARGLLTQFVTLKKIREAPAEKMLTIPGIGKAKYAIIRAALELGRRCIHENTIIGETINNSNSAKRFLIAELSEETREIFACLFLNNRNQVLAFDKLFLGTIAEAAVYPREIVRQGLAHNAAKIILSHNHPSGNPNPSQADKETTVIIQKALSLVDIKVIDHIVVSQLEVFSFADAGWL